LASIENPLVHFILSIVKFNKLFTFDDGTANIDGTSTYYRGEKTSFLKYLMRKIACIKYDRERIKKISSKHYTIYKNFQNIINSTQFIPLSLNGVDRSKLENAGIAQHNNECNVMIGTVYNEITSNKISTLMLLGACEKYMLSTGLPCYYIKHPRSHFSYKFKSMEIIEEPVLAEVTVIKLLQKYKNINLYGFMSTCQVNLSFSGGVVNKIFMSDCININISNEIMELNKKFDFEIVLIKIK
jgi:beta-galactosamide-alpha-2,3-sialyltransferase